MKKITLVLILITIFSKAFGFFRDVTLSYFYGASSVSDAYLISLTIPLVIFGFVGVGISTGYIPMYSKIEKNGGINEGNRYTSNLLNILFIFSTIIILIGCLFTNYIVKIFASGFEGETLSIAVRFTKISLFGIYFSVLIYIFTGFLQYKGSYIIPALIGFPLNLFTIISIYLSTKFNLLTLSFGTLIAALFQFIILLPFIFKRGYRYKFIINIKDKYIRNMASLTIPVILGVSVDQINVLVDRTIASHIASGGISALNYADRVTGFVQSIFVLSITSVMYPVISKMVAEENIAGLKKAVYEAISGINLLVMPATIGAILFAEPIVTVLFGRGAFNSQAVSMTSSALLFFSIGMIGFGLREVLSKAFYSMQDIKTPMVNAVITLLMNITLNMILPRFFGVGGLALATSISSIVCSILLLMSLRKKIGPFGLKNIGKTFIKILVASVLMGLIAKATYLYTIDSFNQMLSLLISIIIGAVTYVLAIYLMRIKDLGLFIKGKKAPSE